MSKINSSLFCIHRICPVDLKFITQKEGVSPFPGLSPSFLLPTHFQLENPVFKLVRSLGIQVTDEH
jgi:hypothetical protein